MRKSIYFILILFILFFPLMVSAGTYEEELQGLSLKIAKNIERSGKRTVAVVDFTDLQGNVTELGRFIAEELSANLVSVRQEFRVIDRLHLKSIIAEHKLSASWFLEPKAVERFGKISGVDAIVTGTVTPFGDSVRVSTKVITTDTAEVIAAATGNIAKTKAIEGLLARGIETTGAAPARPKILKKATKKFVLGDLEFRLLDAKRAGNAVTVYIAATNNGEKEVKLATYPSSCCLYDDLANKYKADRACVGTDCASDWGADDTIIPGVSIKMSVYFKDISPQASVGTLEMNLKIGKSEGKVIFRNISIK